MQVVQNEPTLQKIKLKKKDFLSISHHRLEKDGTITEVTEEHKSPVHPDLKARFAALRVHLALLCDYLSTRQIKDISTYDPELIESFHVSGVSIGGNDDDEGIVITGHKITKAKKAVILNTPFARIEEVEETKYRYMDDLSEKVEALKAEVVLYLGGKRGEVQPEFNFPEEAFEEDVLPRIGNGAAAEDIEAVEIETNIPNDDNEADEKVDKPTKKKRPYKKR